MASPAVTGREASRPMAEGATAILAHLFVHLPVM
jgi:hypothetical protein